ncbi:MAG TPA: glycerol-3-phosphate dehydrogenase/oxidase [Acidimicrobiales bacterium]
MPPTGVVPFQRAAMLRRLADETFDVVVVGGGITGVGVALDAARRGLRTALVEKDDFASGTSSKSSKLVHGGLRYLQQGEIRLVYEALAERQRLRHNAPHLVRVLPFLIPILTRDGVVNAKIARALGTAMWGYDLTGGLRIGKRHKRISAAEALAYVPTMPPERVSSAYLYYDARADDARLCLTVARTAASYGAAVVNHAAVTGLRKGADGTVTGVVVSADGTDIDVATAVVVNATGVWSDEVRALDEGTHPDSIRPAKGIHLTLPWDKVRNEIAVVIPVPKDRRSLFVVPWGDRTYVGTTDTDYDGPLDDPRCTPDDVAYVLRALNRSITTGITEADIVGTWAGLRPLVKQAGGRTADLSRRHQVTTSPSRVVSVTGGKLTTYRRMAADTVDEVMDLLERRGRSRTKRLRLLGAEGYVEPAESAAEAAHLAGRYGSEALVVEALLDTDPALRAPLVPGLPYLAAEAVHAARHEMATTLDDVLARRTRARLLARDASIAAAPAVAALLAPELGWDEATEAAQVRAYVDAASEERDAAGLTAPLDAAFGV